MSLDNYVEFGCDTCNQADHYNGRSLKNARQYFRELGYIFNSKGDFCDLVCFANFINNDQDKDLPTADDVRGILSDY